MISVLYTIILITNFKLIEMCIKSSPHREGREMRDTPMRLGILERISQNRLAQTRLSSPSELFPALPLSAGEGAGG